MPVFHEKAGTTRRKPVHLPAARMSEMLLIRIAPCNTGLFRYLLEGGGGHLAILTVLDPASALFKLLFSPHQREEVRELLESMGKTVPFDILEWPFGTDGKNGTETVTADTGRPCSLPE